LRALDIAKGYAPPLLASPARHYYGRNADESSIHLKERAVAFQLPELPYAYDALQPYMSAETLQYHHDKHHAAYVETANKLLAGTGSEGKSVEDVVKSSYGSNPALFNNASQHYNHTHFWNWMRANGGGTKLPGSVQQRIDSDLGGYDKFRSDFIDAGKGQFGSGWAWLAVKDGKLQIMKTPNGENPLVHGGVPILGVDVWEHSYYIDYRNARPKYLEAFVDHLVNWDYVEQLLAKAG
jgi:Fe-Mn family superoxide dismutase